MLLQMEMLVKPSRISLIFSHVASSATVPRYARDLAMLYPYEDVGLWTLLERLPLPNTIPLMLSVAQNLVCTCGLESATYCCA